MVPFIVSLLLVYAVAGNADALANVPFGQFPAAEFWHPLVGWLLPVLNACLLFTAVLGATGAAHAVERGRKETALTARERGRKGPTNGKGMTPVPSGRPSSGKHGITVGVAARPDRERGRVAPPVPPAKNPGIDVSVVGTGVLAVGTGAIARRTIVKPDVFRP
jgi:hypothetical protein